MAAGSDARRLDVARQGHHPLPAQDHRGGAGTHHQLLRGQTFLGHGRDTESTTAYVKVSLEELAMAIEVLMGERHPLADPAQAKWLSSDYARPAPG